MKFRLHMLSVAAAAALAACSGDYAYTEDPKAPQGPSRNLNDKESVPSLFGEDGLDPIQLLESDEDGNAMPVNRFLWQAALDTLSFMPLSSTDPFTGVIATDWSATPQAPGERFKVTVYVVTPELAASALKVAVYRQSLSEEGAWIASTVNPETPRRIEDAILTRARQIKIADLEAETTG